jgi:tetratricopeptide (TPR) repeat protein
LRVRGAVDQGTVRVTSTAGDALLGLGRIDEALRIVSERVEQVRRGGHEADTTMEFVQFELGKLQVKAGKFQDALVTLEPKAAKVLATWEKNRPHEAAEILNWMGEARFRLGRYAEAEQDLAKARSMISDARGIQLNVRRDNATLLVELYRTWSAAHPEAASSEKQADAQAYLEQASRDVAALALLADEPAAPSS